MMILVGMFQSFPSTVISRFVGITTEGVDVATYVLGMRVGVEVGM